jgi:FtsP/CotA-like multicopper oxidase with cupredoxin domain
VIRAALAAMLLQLATAPAAEPQVFELSIRNGMLVGEERVIRVKQGDVVTLRWTTDKALAIHLHGYDIEMPLSPAAPVSMQFTARASGRFPIEIHAHGQGGHRTLVHVEVHPR